MSPIVNPNDITFTVSGVFVTIILPLFIQFIILFILHVNAADISTSIVPLYVILPLFMHEFKIPVLLFSYPNIEI